MYGITETTVHVTYRRIDGRTSRRAWAASSACPSPTSAFTCSTASGEPVPDRRPRRDVRRRRGRRPRLPEPAGADRGAVRARPLLGASRGAALPDRRPRASSRERRPRVPGSHRSAGEDPRLPDRARRDRGGAVPAARGARDGRRSRARTRRATSASSRTLPRKGTAAISPKSSAVGCARCCPSTWCLPSSSSSKAFPSTRTGRSTRRPSPLRRGTGRPPARGSWSREAKPSA